MKATAKSNFSKLSLISLIGGFFIFDALLNLINSVCYYSSFITGNVCFQGLGGALSYDPMSEWIILAFPIYEEWAIILKEIAIVGLLIYTGYKLMKRAKRGLYLALFITIFGLAITTTWSFKESPMEYVNNLLAFIIPIHDYMWIGMGLLFLINIFIPVYLLLNRKKFK